MKRSKSLIGLAFSSIWVLLVLYGFFLWFACRVYVPEGNSLLLRYKGPLLLGSAVEPQPGRLAQPGELGVLEQMRGPGRHFYNPLYWERTVVPDVLIYPGQIGVVTSKVGNPLPTGKFLVDGDLDGPQRAKHQGILRKVFGPGRYRANPYAYEFNIVGRELATFGSQEKTSGWVEIPTGYVGVVTMQTDNPNFGLIAGIQDKVLQPGLYPINPKEQQIDVINVGYRETSIQTEKQVGRDGKTAYDEQGEPLAVADTGIN